MTENPGTVKSRGLVPVELHGTKSPMNMMITPRTVVEQWHGRV